MYTKCPECNSVFRISTELLEMADGLVRCGICDEIFNGTDHLHEDDKEPLSEDESKIEYKHEFEVDSELDNETYVEIDDDHQDDEDTLIDSDSIPTVIRDDFGGNVLAKANSPLQIIMWTLGSIALALFFLGQITYWQNVSVLPQSWVNNFCAIVGCDSNAERDLSTVRILNRNIFTHPNVKNALMITTSFVNESDHVQHFPFLQIALLNTHGEIVAIRRFSPADYLVNKDLIEARMQPNQPVGARLEVFDPGSTVIAYEIEFY